MKKQIFILVVLVLATFANVDNSFGQTCTDGPLNPVSGVPYTYTVGVTGAGYNGAGTYFWYVTTKADILDPTHIATGAGEIIATGNGAYDNNQSGATKNTLTVEWTSQAIVNSATKPYYLVVKYSQLNSDGACSAENIKVWEVKPINKFLLAINNFTGAIGAAGIFCAGNITSAVVTPSVGATPAKITYNFGTSTIYAEITASNFAGLWTPSFKITGVNALQTISSVNWDIVASGTFLNSTTSSGIGEYVSSSNATAAYDGSKKIYVKIVLANNTYQGLAASTIAVAVDGIIPVGSGTPLADVKTASDCSTEATFGKTTNLTLLARPGVTETLPASPSFIQP